MRVGEGRFGPVGHILGTSFVSPMHRGKGNPMHFHLWTLDPQVVRVVGTLTVGLCMVAIAYLTYR